MTRAADGFTRCINLPFCARTTQLKSPLCVARLVLPLNPETAVWSSDKLLVNKRYCDMCINVPESTTVKHEPGHGCILNIAPLNKCVYVFVHVSARRQGCDIFLY